MMKVVSASIVLLFIFSCSEPKDILKAPGFYPPTIDKLEIYLDDGSKLNDTTVTKSFEPHHIETEIVINQQSIIYPTIATTEINIFFVSDKPREIVVYLVKANASERLNKDFYISSKFGKANNLATLTLFETIINSGSTYIIETSIENIEEGFYMLYVKDRTKLYGYEPKNEIIFQKPFFKTNEKNKERILKNIYEIYHL